jgi:tetratricopeptide (TPR) repeat protein
MRGRPGRVRAVLIACLVAGMLFCASLAAAQHDGSHDRRALREDPRLAAGQIAPVLEGLGDLHHEVTTASPRAQLFFDQGLRLTYGFNHQEALRAFKEAARLDPECAMAYWGWALVLGPNLNLPMREEVAGQAYEAAQMAMAHRAAVSEKERHYIEALATRYSKDPKADRPPLDRAYADAMRSLHARYPADPDAATLYAAALMNLSPWNYWTGDGRPRARTSELVGILEAVVSKNPRHIGALHYFIHAVEAADPERAEPAADALRGLAPGAGHLTHMPSHIYIQVGRYADAAAVNRAAARADEGYIAQCRAQGIYPLNYYPHNIHFLFWATLMEGRSGEALAQARKVAARVPADRHGNDWALYQTFLSTPLYAQVRFGKWQDILEEPAPPEESLFWTGIWHYARAMARVRTGNPALAEKERNALRTIARDPKTQKLLVGFSTGARVLTIAEETLAGEIDAAAGRYEDAIAHLDRAVRLQDGLTYSEPPDWYYPVRHSLGAALLEAGRPEEAEVVFWQDLERFPENGYSLFGLKLALEAQDRREEAVAVDARFQKAWRDADVTLVSSRF